MALVWLQFAAAALAIVVAGSKLSAYADRISDRTGIGKGFIGVLLLGAATSLPEVITSTISVTEFGNADMAVGNLLGSCTFNLLILAILDFLFRLSEKSRASLVGGGLSVGMLLLFALGYFTGNRLPSFYFHPVSLLIFIGYLLSLRVLYVVDKAESSGEQDGADGDAGESLARLLLLTAAVTAVLIGGSVWMAGICDRIAELTGWGGTVVGAFFMALSTSLPELTVSIAAGRMGRLSMAYGNIFGSNIFNVGILGVVDLAYGKSGLFDVTTVQHLAFAAVGILMTLSLLPGLVRPWEFRLFRMRPDSLLLVAIYVAGVLFVV